MKLFNILPLAMGCVGVLLTGCTTNQPVHKPRWSQLEDAVAVEFRPDASVFGDVDRNALLKDARVYFTTSDAGSHTGRWLLGPHTRFRCVLIFPRSLPSAFKPERFFIRMGEHDYPFRKHNGRREYFTDTEVFVAQGLTFGPVPLKAYYRDLSGGATLVAEYGSVTVDTQPPRKPILKLHEAGADYFILTWQPPADDIMQYVVEKYSGGKWDKLPIGTGPHRGSVATPPVHIDQPPQGRVRIVAIDWARNRTASNAVALAIPPLAITSLKILSPEASLYRINDRIVTGRRALSHAYAVEVTVNRESRLLLVNVDSAGHGYRLYPTPCLTGKDFGSRGPMQPGVPRRYPINHHDGIYYIGLDEQKGMEEVYAIAYADEAIVETVWGWVKNELCPQESMVPAKGSRELPGRGHGGQDRHTDAFEHKLNALQKSSSGKVAWTKRSFWHK